MKIKEDLTPREAEKYAKDNGYNSTKISIAINGNYSCCGRFLDAYYGLITIPVYGESMIRLNDICDMYGERNVSINIIDEEEFRSYVVLDFVLKNKANDIPEEYK